MTPRERQVELSKVVAGIEKSIRNREVKALLVVALRHDGKVDHGTVVMGSEFLTLVGSVATVLQKVGGQLGQQVEKGERE
jgi:hypothetical protein